MRRYCFSRFSLNVLVVDLPATHCVVHSEPGSFYISRSSLSLSLIWLGTTLHIRVVYLCICIRICICICICISLFVYCFRICEPGSCCISRSSLSLCSSLAKLFTSELLYRKYLGFGSTLLSQMATT